MSLRSFFLWFWGIVFGSGIAGGATLAVLQSPSKPPPAPAIQEIALTEPLPVPPVPAIGETGTPLPKLHPHMAATRPAHEFRHFAELAPPARITVVPPIPPAQITPSAPSENLARAMRSPPLRSPARAEPREATTPPPTFEPRPRAYAYARNYPRYTYYTYSYPYRYSYYPYPYYYSYSY